jgi:hypothetical protein
VNRRVARIVSRRRAEIVSTRLGMRKKWGGAPKASRFADRSRHRPVNRFARS